MKKFVFVILQFLAISGFAQVPENPNLNLDACAYTWEYGMTSETSNLFGTVRIVTDPKEKADLDLFIAKDGDWGDFEVQFVKEKPKHWSCGVWQIVDKNEDFSIRFVKSRWDADFSIYILDTPPIYHGDYRF